MATGQYRPYKPRPFLPHTDPHRARPDKVDSLCVPVWGTWKLNIVNPKTVPESWEPQDSGTVFGIAIFHFQVPQTGAQSQTTFFVQASLWARPEKVDSRASLRYLEVEYRKSENSSRILRASGFWNCFWICDIPIPSASNWHAKWINFFRPGITQILPLDDVRVIYDLEPPGYALFYSHPD
jgi:hypothetical protein